MEHSQPRKEGLPLLLGEKIAHSKAQGSLWMDKILHETMVETIACWYLQGNHQQPGVLRWCDLWISRPSTVFVAPKRSQFDEPTQWLLGSGPRWIREPVPVRKIHFAPPKKPEKMLECFDSPTQIPTNHGFLWFQFGAKGFWSIRSTTHLTRIARAPVLGQELLLEGRHALHHLQSFRGEAQPRRPDDSGQTGILTLYT